MRKLVPTLAVVLTLAGVGAGSAAAHHRSDGLVFDGAGNLQPDAKDVVRSMAHGGRLNHHLLSGIYTTAEINVTLNGSTYNVPAGTQLSKAEWATKSPATWGGLGISETRPATVTITSTALRTRARNVQTRIEAIRRAGRTLPKLKTLGTIAIAASGVDMGWKIGTPLGDYLYRRITAEDTANGSTITSRAWVHTEDLADAAYAAASVWYDELDGVPGWYLKVNNDVNCVVFYYDGPNSGDSSWGCGSTRNAAAAAWSFANANVMETGTGLAGTPVYDALFYFRTEQQAEDHFDSEPISQSTYDGMTTKADTGTYNPPATYSSTDDDAISDGLGAPGAQTDTQKDTEDAIAEEIEPGSTPGVDPVNPNPTPSGTATDPIHVTPPPTTVPSGGGIDFDPITELDPGCKFPYGLICYAVDVTEWFDVSPNAPAFTFDIPSITVLGNAYGGGDDGYVVDLDVMDTYMGMLRTLISLALWIGGVYFLAANLLGFRTGGDPAEAADEALHV